MVLHGHFYQPPRENPWTEQIPEQPSAHPHHDWNERIYNECYRPNRASRVLDGYGRIRRIVNNFEYLSFNIGPTLFSWLETAHPETYVRILAADRLSAARRRGHGNAIAQAYNHLILPLANPRDRQTQVHWGLRDFELRFARAAEGMWLPETAIHGATVDTLVNHGVRFTVLSPFQARRIRPLAGGAWQDVGGGRIDPRRPYVVRSASGGELVVFFYDGPVSQAMAFEKLLRSADVLAERLALVVDPDPRPVPGVPPERRRCAAASRRPWLATRAHRRRRRPARPRSPSAPRRAAADRCGHRRHPAKPRPPGDGSDVPGTATAR